MALALTPITGRKHQLRVHMAALGASITNDRLYPELSTNVLSAFADDPERPLRLVAPRLAFVDPLDGTAGVHERAGVVSRPWSRKPDGPGHRQRGDDEELAAEAAPTKSGRNVH